MSRSTPLAYAVVFFALAPLPARTQERPPSSVRYTEARAHDLASSVRLTGTVGGSSTNRYRGLGSVVVGGLTISTLFTLILVPALLSLVLDARLSLASRLARL